MPNLVVSSDVDAMLQSVSNAQIRSNIDAASASQVSTNSNNIASVGVQVDGKADLSGATFTGDVNFVNAANLHVRSDTYTNSSAGSPTTGVLKISNDWLQDGQHIKVAGVNALSFEANERHLYDRSGNEIFNFTDVSNVELDGSRVTIGSNSTSILNVNSQATFNTNVTFDAGASFEAGNSVEFQCPVAFQEDIQAKNIKCFGTTTGTAQPINFSSNEHRFKDFDGNPDSLMVIEKLDGFTGARVGINRDTDDSPGNQLQAALHVVAGRNVNDADDFDLGLRVGKGGAHFEKFIRIGHYSDDDRDDIEHLSLGQVIYNIEHDEFQAYMTNGTAGNPGSGRQWKAFQMTSIST